MYMYIHVCKCECVSERVCVCIKAYSCVYVCVCAHVKGYARPINYVHIVDTCISNTYVHTQVHIKVYT